VETLTPDEQAMHDTCVRLAAEKETARLQFNKAGEALNDLRSKCNHRWGITEDAGRRRRICLICGEMASPYRRGTW
jgi:hypothetical protein